MATKDDDKGKIYDKIESIILDKVFILEAENAQLRADLALARAKLEVYDRITSISDSQKTIGFVPQLKEGGNQAC